MIVLKNKKNIKVKIICLLSLLIIVLGVSGCMTNSEQFEKALSAAYDAVNENTKDSVDKAVEELNKKYGEEFEITKVGNRINTDSISMYACPKNNSDIVFTVYVNKQDKSVTDDYVERMVAVKLQNEIEKSLSLNGVEVSTNVLLSCPKNKSCNDVNISIDEFFEICNVDTVLMYTAIDFSSINSDTAKNIINTITEISKKYNTEFVFDGYVINENYSECRYEMKSLPKVTSTWFDKYNHCCMVSFFVDDGICSQSESDINDILQRSE